MWYLGRVGAVVRAVSCVTQPRVNSRHIGEVLSSTWRIGLAVRAGQVFPPACQPRLFRCHKVTQLSFPRQRIRHQSLIFFLVTRAGTTCWQAAFNNFRWHKAHAIKTGRKPGAKEPSTLSPSPWNVIPWQGGNVVKKFPKRLLHDVRVLLTTLLSGYMYEGSSRKFQVHARKSMSKGEYKGRREDNTQVFLLSTRFFSRKCWLSTS
jgi:hypothetical protein